MVTIQETLNSGGLLSSDIFELSSFFYSSAYVLMFSFFVVYVVSIKTKTDKFHNFFIFFYHLLFSLLFFYLTINKPNDADTYYQRALYLNIFEIPKAFPLMNLYFIELINHYLINFFKLNFYSLTLLYSLLGSLGLIFLNQVFIHITFDNTPLIKNIARLIIFLPSLSFWSSMIGKDALVFFILCLCLNILYFSKFNFKIVVIITTLILLLISVRFYIGIIFMMCVFVHLLIHSKLKKPYLLALFFLLSLFGLFIVNYFFQVDFNQDFLLTFFTKINSYGSLQRSYLSHLDGWVDTSNYNYLQLFLNFLFNPILKFNSLKNIGFSIENIFTLSFIFLFFIKYYKNIKFITKNNFYVLIYLFISVFLLMNFTSNTGLISREKVMILPFLFFYLLISIKKS